MSNTGSCYTQQCLADNVGLSNFETINRCCLRSVSVQVSPDTGGVAQQQFQPRHILTFSLAIGSGQRVSRSALTVCQQYLLPLHMIILSRPASVQVSPDTQSFSLCQKQVFIAFCIPIQNQQYDASVVSCTSPTHGQNCSLHLGYHAPGQASPVQSLPGGTAYGFYNSWSVLFSLRICRQTWKNIFRNFYLLGIKTQSQK